MRANSTRRSGRIGFRRSQSVAYRPSCIDCSACVSVRVLAAEFEPSATQRKLLRRHADLEVSACKPWTTDEQYAAAPPLSRRAPPRRRHGRDGRERFRRHGRADAGPHLRHRISRAVGRRPAGQAGRRLPERPAGRRPVDDLQLLRCRAGARARASAPTSSSTTSSAPRAPACPTSTSAIGSKARPRMAYKTSFRPLERLGRDGWRRMDEAEPTPPVDAPRSTCRPAATASRLLIDA